MHLRNFVWLLIATVMAGCASTQLNSNTENIVAHYEDLSEAQIAFNLVKAVSDPSRVPTHISVSAGTVTTQDSLTPTFGFPLSSTVADAVSTAVASGVAMSGPTSSNSITKGVTKTTAGSTFGIGGTAQWNQSWTITPETDPDVIRRLRTLYKYATSTTKSMNNCDFFQGYTIQKDLAGDDIESDECKKTGQYFHTIFGVNPEYRELSG